MSENSQLATFTPQEVECMQKFEMAAKSLMKSSTIDINNVVAAFESSKAIIALQALLTDEVMKTVFMPIMNRKIGFLTDRNGRPNAKTGEIKPTYGIDVVRDCLIDAMSCGLTPTLNQFNIISERMYPTKEGFTALLKQKEVKYFFTFGPDISKTDGRAEIQVKIDYEWKGEKKNYTFIANVKKDNFATYDNIKGKAERSAKKHLYEFITGIDFGEADENTTYEDVSDKKKPAARQTIEIKPSDAEKSFTQPAQAAQPAEAKTTQAAQTAATPGF